MTEYALRVTRDLLCNCMHPSFQEKRTASKIPKHTQTLGSSSRVQHYSRTRMYRGRDELVGLPSCAALLLVAAPCGRSARKARKTTMLMPYSALDWDQTKSLALKDPSRKLSSRCSRHRFDRFRRLTHPGRCSSTPKLSRYNRSHL